jgi:acetylornithine/succinyldiaminopimelate/putrescine aminotransferase
MDKYSIVVAGDGITSRANVEALVEDYVYANGNDVFFILTYVKTPSSAQKFVAQWAKDKSKDIIIQCNADASFEGMPGASVVTTENPFKQISQKHKTVAFVLPNYDKAEETASIVKEFKSQGVECYDLTQGLISLNDKIIEQIPVAPIIAENTPKADESLQVPNLLYEAILRRLQEDGYISKKPSKGA